MTYIDAHYLFVAGFEKGDFLVREEQGNRVYFDFFEEVSTVLCVQCIHSSPNAACQTQRALLYAIHACDFQAFNYISNKGYSRMPKDEEKQWMELMTIIHDSVKGGMK